jgi:hypothetical protein
MLVTVRIFAVALVIVAACAPTVVAPEQPALSGERVLCPAGLDSDRDQLSDTCELAFAQAFAPDLIVARSACNWDGSVNGGRIGGGYYFGMRRVDTATIRIAYLPAYYEDCGWKGMKCHQPFIPCDRHAGDSEFIVLDVVHVADDVWQTRRIFLSSHCFDKLDAACRWYEGNDLNRFEWRGARYGAPAVWVADGKGAHYPSRADCDRAHLFYDTCDQNDAKYEYPIAFSRQNIGSASHPAGDDRGCVSWDWTGVISKRVVAGTYECFWDPRSLFRGWQRPASGGSTPYHKYLTEVAGF